MERSAAVQRRTGRGLDVVCCSAHRTWQCWLPKGDGPSSMRPRQGRRPLELPVLEVCKVWRWARRLCSTSSVRDVWRKQREETGT